MIFELVRWRNFGEARESHSQGAGAFCWKHFASQQSHEG